MLEQMLEAILDIERSTAGQTFVDYTADPNPTDLCYDANGCLHPWRSQPQRPA